MDRRGFFKELARSLTETGKEIISPILENDMEKLDRATNIIAGRDWFPIAAPSEGYTEQMVNGELIGIFYDGQEAKAFSKKCPDCRELLQWIAYEQNLHCPNCDRSYSFSKKEGTLAPSFFAIRQDKEGWWVALSV